MAQPDYLENLRKYLAKATDLEDARPALYSRVERGRIIPWTPEGARAQGRVLVRALEAACSKGKVPPPPWLRRQLEVCGQIKLSTSLLELTAGERLGPSLRANDIFAALAQKNPKFEQHEAFVRDALKRAVERKGGVGVGRVYMGRQPLRGLVWAGAWDQPMLIAAVDLVEDSEPPWLVYDATVEAEQEAEQEVPPMLPVGADFETVLALHLTGLHFALSSPANRLPPLLEAASEAQTAGMRGPIQWTLKQAQRAALDVRDRTEVRVPNVRPQQNNAVVARLSDLRGAEFFTKDPVHKKWSDVTFVAAYLQDPKRTKAIMKAAAKTRLKAPKPATQLLERRVSDVIGGSYEGAEPCYVAGSVAEVAKQLRSSGFPVLVPDEFGDFDNFSSLADGAAHVLERVKDLQAALG